MAWNTGTSYSGGSPITAALINGIGADFRTWGGNVDAAGNQLVNCGGIAVTSGNVGIGTGSPVDPLHIHLATNKNLNVLLVGGVVSVTAINDAHNANCDLALFALSYQLNGLPSSNPGAGTKQIWYDPSDGNR